jgi:hypothetical protein
VNDELGKGWRVLDASELKAVSQVAPGNDVVTVSELSELSGASPTKVRRVLRLMGADVSRGGLLASWVRDHGVELWRRL